jgi:hypothetical protein
LGGEFDTGERDLQWLESEIARGGSDNEERGRRRKKERKRKKGVG